MRLETFPLIVGAILAVIGLGLVIDAWTPDQAVKRERRRRRRAERNRGGEASIGLGVIAMAAALIGRDTWKYSVIAVVLGTALLLYGILRNRHFLGESISNRGTLRRRP
jgi:hypothetical protein